MATDNSDAVHHNEPGHRSAGSRWMRSRWMRTDADLVPLVDSRSSDDCDEDAVDEGSVQWVGPSTADCGSAPATAISEHSLRNGYGDDVSGSVRESPLLQQAAAIDQLRRDDVEMLPLGAEEHSLLRAEPSAGERTVGQGCALSGTAAAEQWSQSEQVALRTAEGCEQQQQNDWSAQLPPPPFYAGPSSLTSTTQQQRLDESEERLFEPPPPYTATQPRFTRCKVCRKLINIENKQHLLVVKCLACSEVTPLREPPMGKRYLRCSCNCLMMVDSRAGRVTCARPSCQRIITIRQQQNGLSTAASRPRGRIVARCAHCRLTFQYDARGKKLVRCPHCRKVSVIDHRYKVRMAGVFAFFGVALLLAAITACGVAVDNENGSWGMFSFLAVSILVSLVFLQRTYYYCHLRVSRPCRPMDVSART